MTTVAAGVSHLEQAAGALGAARDHLLKRQDPAGWWKAELQTNVTMDAEDLLLRHFLGILEPEVARASARWIRSQQQPDGSWNTFHGGPPDLSTTIEAYVALRLAGDEPTSPHLQAAAALVRAGAASTASRVFTRIWLALVRRGGLGKPASAAGRDHVPAPPRRSTSTTSGAGPGRPSWPSPW